MTYLGTRPILPDELEQYELHHRARIAIKPGITGMWQVSGRSDITDFEEIVRLDTEYISEWNAVDAALNLYDLLHGKGDLEAWKKMQKKSLCSGFNDADSGDPEKRCPESRCT